MMLDMAHVYSWQAGWWLGYNLNWRQWNTFIIITFTAEQMNVYVIDWCTPQQLWIRKDRENNRKELHRPQ